ncbi:shikimate dehydrogenase [Calditerrivibrio nitroreducens]|uniref:Shikimate dehydrogenase (NADP(+)) n=1 Tax=Calditerrivibrio nitroreducens (strain DSM 19672 / NBRC 101217 / Yu37-1) TaxID=768670 RepID=E4TFI3_CALNY|nr:shikimate dehydrogenase [Calditerrivibrio nitroreducens]ADR19556.1 shikimate 5-dehydrogenase [Calditerrivibrio nitroreducens DSM 19672]
MYKNFGLIGKPISHSISPKIHNIFLYTNRLNGGYCCFELEDSQLPDVIDLFKKMHFTGFNVTLPYKERIIDFLDGLESDAEKIGAVNTVKIENGKLIGYNTDIFGIRETFKFYNVDLSKKVIVVLGAGGAARGLLYELRNHDYEELIIVNRTVEKGFLIAEEFEIKKYSVKDLNSFDYSKKYDIIINSSSAGLSGGAVFGDLKADVAFDMQYDLEKKTIFLEKVDCKRGFDGLVMLVGQAYKAFCIWNGFDFSINYDEVIKML